MIRKSETPEYVKRRRMRHQWKVLAELERQAAESRRMVAEAQIKHERATHVYLGLFGLPPCVAHL